MTRYKVDIVDPRETRFSEQGQLEEVDRRDADVDLVIPKDIVERLPCLPQDINHRLISLCLPLRVVTFAIIISVYASLHSNQLQRGEEILRGPACPPGGGADKRIAFNDFIVHVGADHAAWREVLVTLDIGDRNDNSLLLLRTCAKHCLLPTNNLFRLPLRERQPECTHVRGAGI
nr:unnamed protein product [Spirometra erinaceieuropaei]